VAKVATLQRHFGGMTEENHKKAMNLVDLRGFFLFIYSMFHYR